MSSISLIDNETVIYKVKVIEQLCASVNNLILFGYLLDKKN